MRLTLGDLERHDPNAPPARGDERRFCCPLPACAEKPRDAAHRTLGLNVGSREWQCFRCHAKGRLNDGEERPRRRDWWREGFKVPEAKAAEADNQWRGALKGLAPLSGTPGEAYLEQRGIPADLAHKSGVRFSPKWYDRPAVVFPVRDGDGQLVAAQGRYIDGRTPKTRDAGPKGRGVFAAHGAMAADPMVLVEGPIDALSLAAAGTVAVALMGCSASDIVAWSCARRTVAVALDADEAGDAAAAKLLPALAARGCRAIRLRPKDGQDWNDMLLEWGPERLGEAVRAALAVPADAPETALSSKSDAPRERIDLGDVPAEESAPSASEEQAAEDEAWREMAAVLPDADLITWVREKWGAVLMLDGAGKLKAVGAAAVPSSVREEIRGRQAMLTAHLKRRGSR